MPLPLSITIDGIATPSADASRVCLPDLPRESPRLSGTRKGCSRGACGARLTACHVPVRLDVPRIEVVWAGMPGGVDDA